MGHAPRVRKLCRSARSRTVQKEDRSRSGSRRNPFQSCVEENPWEILLRPWLPGEPTESGALIGSMRSRREYGGDLRETGATVGPRMQSCTNLLCAGEPVCRERGANGVPANAETRADQLSSVHAHPQGLA